MYICTLISATMFVYYYLNVYIFIFIFCIIYVCVYVCVIYLLQNVCVHVCVIYLLHNVCMFVCRHRVQCKQFHHSSAGRDSHVPDPIHQSHGAIQEQLRAGYPTHIQYLHSYVRTYIHIFTFYVGLGCLLPSLYELHAVEPGRRVVGP